MELNFGILMQGDGRKDSNYPLHDLAPELPA